MVERRAVQRHNRMVCFDDGADRFQMRAAGIAIRDGRVLVQNIKGDPITFLPGGRIDQNEASGDAVVREIEEEFGRTVVVGALLFVIESFYPEKTQLFHEVGFFYPIAVPDDFPYHETDICHRCLEGPVEMEYRWIPATDAALTAAAFYPQPLRSRLETLPTTMVHIVDHEVRMSAAHTFPVRVYYEDTDFSGNVYHASYLRFMERGRTEFLRDAGIHHSELIRDGLFFAVRSMEIQFDAAAHIDDALEVITEVSDVSGARLRLTQTITRASAVVARARVVVVAVKSDGRPARMPPAIRGRFGGRAV